MTFVFYMTFYAKVTILKKSYGNDFNYMEWNGIVMNDMERDSYRIWNPISLGGIHIGFVVQWDFAY